MTVAIRIPQVGDHVFQAYCDALYTHSYLSFFNRRRCCAAMYQTRDRARPLANAYTQPPVRSVCQTFHRTSPWRHRLSKYLLLQLILFIRYAAQCDKWYEKKTIHDTISTRRNTPTTVNRKKHRVVEHPHFLTARKHIYRFVRIKRRKLPNVAVYTRLVRVDDEPPLPQFRCS